MSEVRTHLSLEGDDLVVHNYQDAQDVADWAKVLSEEWKTGGDFKPKWSLPNTEVINFYNRYCGDGLKPMNQEFWEWVDKQMKDPQYQKFWARPSNPFRVGYGS